MESIYNNGDSRQMAEKPEADSLQLTGDTLTEGAVVTVDEARLAAKSVARHPEAILAHVAKAAEKDLPIEAQYEKRHEVKDEARRDFSPIEMVDSTGGATPVGDIAGQRLQAVPGPWQNPPTTPPPLMADGAAVDFRRRLLRYKKVITIGVLAGLILFAAIILLG